MVSRYTDQTISFADLPLETTLKVMEALNKANLAIVPLDPNEDMLSAATEANPELRRHMAAKIYQAMLEVA